jgi:hypothetical protein
MPSSRKKFEIGFELRRSEGRFPLRKNFQKFLLIIVVFRIFISNKPQLLQSFSVPSNEF